MQRNRHFLVTTDIGPAISQRLLLFILLIVMLVTFILSAYIQNQKVERSRLYCARLNQRLASELYWDGVGCAMKTERIKK